MKRIFGRVQTCDEYVNDSQTESGFADGGINIYDIYADVCGPERQSDEALQFARVLGLASKSKALTEGTRGTVPFQSMALSAEVALPESGKRSTLRIFKLGRGQ